MYNTLIDLEEEMNMSKTESNSKQMIDINSVGRVEIQVSEGGKKVWVNVDGECRFRAYSIPRLVIEDEREKLESIDTNNPPAIIRKWMERKIAERIVQDALEADYAISVNNGGDEDEIEPSTNSETILKMMFATDQEYLIMWKDGKRAGWVFLVYGNDGYDVVNDYTIGLEHVMNHANGLGEAFSM